MFLQSGQRWEDSRLLLVLRHRLKSTKIGSMKWLTRAELLCKYNNDASIVDAIVANKKKSGDCKPHPDCDTIEQYHVWDNEETREEDETSQEMETHLDVGVSKELMDTFWRTSSQSAHGAANLDKPKKPKKEKQDLTEAEQVEQDAKKLLKELGTTIAQSAEWAATVEKSDAVASNLKMMLTHDLTNSKTELEAGLFAGIHVCVDLSWTCPCVAGLCVLPQPRLA
jgi:hypothetical protein